MPSGVLTAVKWIVAVAVLLLLARYAWNSFLTQLDGALSIDSGTPTEGETDDAAPATPQVEEGASEAVGDRVVFGTTLTGTEAESQAVGAGAADLMLIAFDPPVADPACLTTVRLAVFLLRADAAPVEIEVVPASAEALLTLADGDNLAAPPALDTPTPATATTDGTVDWVAWDVQPIFSQAARGAHEGQPMLFAVRLAGGQAEEALVVLASTRDPEGRRPRLAWEAIADCDELFGDAIETPTGDASPAEGQTPPTEQPPAEEPTPAPGELPDAA